MVEAKKKELASWFSNSVWEFSEMDGTDSDRVESPGEPHEQKLG